MSDKPPELPSYAVITKTTVRMIGTKYRTDFLSIDDAISDEPGYQIVQYLNVSIEHPHIVALTKPEAIMLAENITRYFGMATIRDAFYTWRNNCRCNCVYCQELTEVSLRYDKDPQP